MNKEIEIMKTLEKFLSTIKLMEEALCNMNERLVHLEEKEINNPPLRNTEKN